MNSERHKREEEIERLTRGAALTPEAEAAFQEEVRKTASAIYEQETRRIQKTERPERPKRSISPAAAGWWLIVLAVAAFVFSMPGIGGAFLVCGVAAILWDVVRKLSKKNYRIIKSRRAS
jgi:hypothetical protein